MTSGWAMFEVAVCAAAALVWLVYVGWSLWMWRRRSLRRLAVLAARHDRIAEDMYWKVFGQADSRLALVLRGQRIGWGELAHEIIADATDSYLTAGDQRLRKAVA